MAVVERILQKNALFDVKCLHSSIAAFLEKWHTQNGHMNELDVLFKTVVIDIKNIEFHVSYIFVIYELI
jgi:hypothetical protein